MPVVCGAIGSDPDNTLDAELAVAEALETLGYAAEIMEVELDLALIERLPSLRPLVIFNLVDAIDSDGRSHPACRRGSMPLEPPIRVAARVPCQQPSPRSGQNGSSPMPVYLPQDGLQIGRGLILTYA